LTALTALRQPTSSVVIADFRNKICQKRTHAAQQRGLLFDYFVDTAKQGNRHCDAECLRCLEVDNELDFRCLLDWQVGRFLTPENTARINAGEPI
jgi:hypothetical protein